MESSAALAIAALWALFLASHMGLSSQRLRPALVRSLGTRGFLGAYSLVALVIFVPLVWIYATNKHSGAFFWYGSAHAWTRPTVYVLMVLAMTLTIGAFLNPSPASIAPGSGSIRGVLRVTRHPLFMGVALFGLLHLCVAQVHAAELAFFGGLPIVTLIGCWHQDQRKLATLGDEFRTFYEQTPFLPFTGPGAIRGLMEQPVAALLGALATGVIRYFHQGWFGGAA